MNVSCEIPNQGVRKTFIEIYDPFIETDVTYWEVSGGWNKRRSNSRILKYKWVHRGGDLSSRVAIPTLEGGHEVNFESMRMMVRVSDKTWRQLQERMGVFHLLHQ
nr:unnamed protein product [Spirometra erinaceieuropaei]